MINQNAQIELSFTDRLKLGFDGCIQEIKEHKKTALIILAVVCLAVCLPTFAFGAEWWDIGGKIDEAVNGAISEFLNSVINSFLNTALGFYSVLNIDDILTKPFSSLLSSTFNNPNAKDVVNIGSQLRNIWEVSVLPLGNSILALVFLVKFIKLSERMDGSQTIPAVKELASLATIFILMSLLVSNSYDICAGIFTEINKISTSMTDVFTAKGNKYEEITIKTGEAYSGGALLSMVIVCLLFLIVAIISAVISFAACWARAIQLYVMAVFSPIPIAFLGLDETRSIGIGFLKNFAAVCLAGAIMLLLMYLFPLMLMQVIADLRKTYKDPIDLSIEAFGKAALINVKLLALSVIYCKGLTSAGQWARDILGS